MSADKKNPILITVTVLTAIVGLITAVYKCGIEQQNFIDVVNNSTQEEIHKPNQPTPNTETNDPSWSEPKPPTATKTSITIVYQGDQYGCTLPISITIGDQTFQPTGNSYTVYNIPLGTQQYRIQGNISCPTLGACSAYGGGTLNIREFSTFAIRWQNTAYAQCSIGLFEQ